MNEIKKSKSKENYDRFLRYNSSNISKTIDNNKLIKELVEWLKKDGNSEHKLSNLLGYKSAITIYQWIKRGHIPCYQIKQVSKLIGYKKKGKLSE